MRKNVTLREWIKNFNYGKYLDKDVAIQINAGWYDWFCSDTSLMNKTKKMGNIIKQLKEDGKVNLDETYVWFKNNCPLSGPLFDDFRIASLLSDEVLYTVQINSPWEKDTYTVYGSINEFKKPLFQTKSSKELVKWLNYRGD